MKKRNRAFVKFDSLYPNDKILLVDLINHARTQKGCPLVMREDKEHIGTEMMIVRKKRHRVKFSDEDRLWQDKRKRISKSTNIIDGKKRMK